MVKLALVDDDPRLLESLKNHLQTFGEIESIRCSTSGLGFVAELDAISPHELPEVIIMDVSMSTPDEGIQATIRIKKRFPFINVIMFTISDNDDLIFEAFKAGAMGYLLKNEAPAFIVKTIMDVKGGNAQMSPGIARKAISYMANTVRVVKEKEEESEALSARELETINLVAKGYTYNQIGDMLNISPNTAKKHMTNIFSKLHVKNKIEALIKTESYRERL